MAEYRKIGDCAYSRPGATTAVINGELKEYATDVPVFESAGLRIWEQVTNKIINSSAVWNRKTNSAAVDGVINSSAITAKNGLMLISTSAVANQGITAGSVVSSSVVFEFLSGTSSDAEISFLIDGDMSMPSPVKVSFSNFSVGELIKVDLPFYSIPANGLYTIYGGHSSGSQLNIKIHEGQISTSAVGSPIITTNGSSATCPKSACSAQDFAALSADSFTIKVTVTKSQEAVDRFLFSSGNISLKVNDTNCTLSIGTDTVVVNGLLPDGVETQLTVVKTPTQITLNGTSVALTQTVSPSGFNIGCDQNQNNQLNGNIKNIEVKPNA